MEVVLYLARSNCKTMWERGNFACLFVLSPIPIPSLVGMDSGRGVVSGEEFGVREVRVDLQELFKPSPPPVTLQ